MAVNRFEPVQAWRAEQVIHDDGRCHTYPKRGAIDGRRLS